MAEQLPAVAQEIAVVERQVGTADYWRSEPMQQRYRDLLDARDVGGAVPASPSAAEQRIAAIERMMRDPRSEYWRGERASSVQAEYRALVAGRDGVADAIVPEVGKQLAAPEAWRASPDAARTRLPAAVAQEWDEAGALAGNLGRLQDALGLILGGIGEEGAAAAFLDGFRALPEHARATVLREAGRAEAGYIRPATDGELGEFRKLFRGDEILRAWGAKARHHVAVALERANRMHDAMSAGDRSAFAAWLRGLPPRSRAAWWLGLAG